MVQITGYTILQTLYESAGSCVCSALRDSDQRPVILKILKEDTPPSVELTRYRQEYDITRRLAELDGVITVYSMETIQNRLVMCFEDIRGESLRIRLDKKYAFTLDELLTLAIRITEILGQIHQHHNYP